MHAITHVYLQIRFTRYAVGISQICNNSSLFNSKFPNKFTFTLCHGMTRCDIECIIDSSDRQKIDANHTTRKLI